MKNYILQLAAATLLIFSAGRSAGQGLSVNTTGSVADPSSVLDLSSTSKGVLVPRMTTAQRNAIASPATGLLIFQTDGTSGFYYYDGAAWTAIGGTVGAAPWLQAGNAGTNPATDFVGTSDNNALRLRANNTWAGELNPNGNSSYGFKAGRSATTGTNNTATGAQSLEFNTSGNDNTATGFQSLNSNTTGIGNTAAGYNSLLSNTIGHDNVAAGHFALQNNIDGDFNTANGAYCLSSNLTGNQNTATGASSLNANTSGNNNTASGYGSLSSNIGGNENSAFGAQCLPLNTASNNTAVGYRSMYSSTTGYENTASGVQSLYANTTGIQNTAFGYRSLFSSTTGDGNTAVGYLADVSSGALSNATVIGSNATVNASDKVRIGNSSVTVIEGQVAYSFPSDGRFKTNIREQVPGLDFIMKLRPVTYNFQTEKFDRFTGVKESTIQQNTASYKKSEAVIHTGFVAQEVEKAANELHYDFDGVHKPANEHDNYSVAYAEFTVPLVKGMQEQQKMIEELQKKNNTQQQQIAELMQRLKVLENKTHVIR